MSIPIGLFGEAPPQSSSTMDQLNHEELKTSMESLLSTLKCPVCLVLVDKDFITCVQGHATCKKCQGKQTSCPTCRQSFSNVQQNTIVKQILEEIPHHCRFDKCEKLVRAGEDHEIFCRFRTTKCEYSGCGWIGPVDNLTFHLEDKHPKEKVFSGEKNLVKVSKSFVDSNGILLFSAGGHFFWQKMCDGTYHKGFSYVPLWVGKPTQDLYIRIWFQADGKEYDAAMKLKTSQNDCAATFYIPTFVLSNLYDGNELKYHVIITEERKEAINVLLL